MRGDGEEDCVQRRYGPRGQHRCKARVGAAAGGHRHVHAWEARWPPVGADQGGGAAARRGDAAAARSSIGGWRVLGDVLGVDGREIG